MVGTLPYAKVTMLVKFTRDGIHRRHVVDIEFTRKCIGKSLLDNVFDDSATLGREEYFL